MRTKILRTIAAALALPALVLLAVAPRPAAQEAGAPIANLRGLAPLAASAEPPRMAPPESDGGRRARFYPEQPPTIPHKIDGYQIDRNANQCLSCHARRRVAESGAPMVSITHFMDRDGQVRAAVSPRRYFCTQCHVPQMRVSAPVGSSFKDMGALIGAPARGK